MIIDFLLIAVVLTSAAIGFRRGFGSMAISFAAFALSIVLTFILYENVYNIFISTDFGIGIQKSVTEGITKSLSESTAEKLPFLYWGIKSDSTDAVNRIISVKAVKVITSLAVLISSYVLSKLLIAILKRIIKTATSLPVIHLTDSLLGLAGGLLLGVVWFGLIYLVLSYLILVPDIPYLKNQYESSVIIMLITDFII